MLLSALLPQSVRDFEGVNVLFLPPLLLLTRGVDLVVMDRAEGDCEFVADLEAQPSEIERNARGERERGSVRRRGKAGWRRNADAPCIGCVWVQGWSERFCRSSAADLP